MRIAIDFDNTIVNSRYPKILGLKPLARWAIKRLYKHHTIIINTCRAFDAARAAQNYLDAHGVPYDYFNENDHALIDFYETDTRKISADIYIDDKNLWGVHNLVLAWAIISLKTLKWKPVKKPLIFAVVGESGSGKTLMSEYIEKHYNIPMIESYTDRPRRKANEKGHAFLSKEEFNGLGTKDLLAITRFGGNRYACLISDLEPVNTYVIDEAGLDMLLRYNNVKWDVVSIRLNRKIGDRIESVGEDRVARDVGRFTKPISSYNHYIPHSDKQGLFDKTDNILKGYGLEKNL